MSELSKAKRPKQATSGHPCGGGQLECSHYMRCGDHCAGDRYDCTEPPIGWRWYYVVAQWAPVCEGHFYVQGLSSDYRLLNDELVAA